MNSPPLAAGRFISFPFFVLFTAQKIFSKNLIFYLSRFFKEYMFHIRKENYCLLDYLLIKKILYISSNFSTTILLKENSVLTLPRKMSTKKNLHFSCIRNPFKSLNLFTYSIKQMSKEVQCQST